MSSNDPLFIREMVDIFKDQMEEYKSKMPQLNEAKDYTSLSKLAHKAKSSVAIMGMTREAEMLKELELMAIDGINSSEYGDIITTFLENSEIAIQELEQEL